MTPSFDYDVAILGLGSAGERLARQSARSGLRVIGFEPNLVGGECPFTACMPSKSLLYDACHTDRSWPEAVSRRDEIVNDRNDNEHAEGLTSEGVTLVRESATIAGEQRVSSSTTDVTAKYVVVATGAEAQVPPIEGFDSDVVWTSADALTSEELPNRLLIVGGGPIGSELGEVYSRYGSAVTLIERAERFVSGVEECVSQELVDHLERVGVRIQTGVEVARIEAGGEAIVELSTGQSIVVDRVLNATGTTPRLSNLGLEQVGLTPSTSIREDGLVGGLDWLFAAGDVTPFSHWTHGANYQADSLALRFSGNARKDHGALMPHCIFTSPPLGVVGVSSDDATRNGLNVVVGMARFDEIARGATDELASGVAAIVVDVRTRRIIGSSIFGPRADDLVQIVTGLIATGATIDQAGDIIFPFPTMSQVLEAAFQDAARQMRST